MMLSRTATPRAARASAQARKEHRLSKLTPCQALWRAADETVTQPTEPLAWRVGAAATALGAVLALSSSTPQPAYASAAGRGTPPIVESTQR